MTRTSVILFPIWICHEYPRIVDILDDDGALAEPNNCSDPYIYRGDAYAADHVFIILLL